MRWRYVPGPWRALRREEGFTLIELLTVAVIIVLMAAFALPAIANTLDRSKEAKAERDLREIQVALERFYTDHGFYPERLELLISYTSPATGEAHNYLKHNIDFRSPFSTSQRTMYYFYAVDDNHPGEARAYLLADPGPRPATGSRLKQEGPVPAGKDPSTRTWAWACVTSGSPRLTLDPPWGTGWNCTTVDSVDTTLRSYRNKEKSPLVRSEG